MIELCAALVVSAVAMTFFTDAMSRAVRLVKPRRRGQVHVADAEQSA